ncbi:uracil-DNA glycosylase family protein [Parasphingopyxis sp.]|uniref:uracil-DNA glycosylase family protein n=1 Tax=Parasphingopyxis sp. TaxID=1920299 RepID=UPI00261DF17D|nr:uracil-DNA glycosylase family protein [Parasphingopyxis sp.]
MGIHGKRGQAISDGIDNLVSWWREAGVDTIVGDEPRSWLEEPKKPRVAPAAKNEAPTVAPTPNMADMPSELAAFRQWLLSSEALAAPISERLDAIGDPTTGLMILVDMPEQGDREAGGLLSGDTGLLFDRMLAAIGRDRASAYVVPLSPARIAGGAIDENALETLGSIARHHVALAGPERLLTMSDAPSRVFCGAGLDESRGTQHIFNHDGGTVSVTATFHPRFLLQQPRFKAQSWKDLQMLIEGIHA